jgi:hypothetical protein
MLLGTVITSFPSAWDHQEPHGLKKKLDEEIKTNKQRDPIRSVDHLVHLVIKLSVDFLRRDAPGDIKFQEAFQSSINNIVRAPRKLCVHLLYRQNVPQKPVHCDIFSPRLIT